MRRWLHKIRHSFIRWLSFGDTIVLNAYITGTVEPSIKAQRTLIADSFIAPCMSTEGDCCV